MQRRRHKDQLAVLAEIQIVAARAKRRLDFGDERTRLRIQNVPEVFQIRSDV